MSFIIFRFFFRNVFVINVDFGPKGPPIHGALLSSDFRWWRPAVVGGVSVN